MLTNNTRKAYSEILEFIELLSDDEKNKIPKKLIDFLEKEKDNDYKKEINPQIPIINQNLKEETLALIAMLNLKFLCDDEDERNRLKKIYFENEKNYQAKLRNKYNPDDLFKGDLVKTKNTEIFNLPLDEKKEGFLKKFINYFKRIFKKN